MPLLGEIRELALPGVKLVDVALLPDERGFFAEIMRRDWSSIFEDEIVQANLSFSYPGIVRAWHRHTRGQVDYFLVVQGAAKICAYDDEESTTSTKCPLVGDPSSSSYAQIFAAPCTTRK